MSTAAQALNGRGLLAVLVAVVLAAFSALAGLVIVAQLLVAPIGSSGDSAVADIPAGYLVLYRAAAARYGLGAGGWSVLAGVGEVECDHGRGPGCGRGERNSAGAAGPAQFLAGTWERYGVDGNGDGDRDVFDPVDAIFAMARYLRASGAPRDWRAALFAYNHAGWYVERVLAQAAAYRRAATTAPAGAPTSGAAPGAGSWLAPLPGFAGERCDARIIPDVVALVAAFGLHVSDCFGGSPPHALHGEHPLGLAIDAEPADGDWGHTMAMARAFGWDESCAASGCPGRGPFRVVLYNGYPSHGDPAHSRVPHIHVSWQHASAAPFTAAARVRTLTAVSSTTTTTSSPGLGAGR